MVLSSRYVRPALLVTTIGLCLVALWITDFLMQLHAPVKVQAANTDQGSYWADICGAADSEQGAGCEEIVTGEDGYVTIHWPVTYVEQTKDKQGKMIARRVKKNLPFKIPVAQFGQCYYIFILVWFVFTGIPHRQSRHWHFLPMATAVVALGVSIYFIFVMAGKDTWCPLCVRLHIIDFILCATVLCLWPRTVAEPAKPAVGGSQKLQPAVPAAGLRFRHALAALTCTGALVWMSFLHRYDLQQTANALVKSVNVENVLKRAQKSSALSAGAYDSTDRIEIPIREGLATRGRAQAKHELVIFSDLQCPACRRFETNMLPKIVEAWRGDLRVTFRHFPLSKACNPKSKINHVQACAAAYAAEAANIVGGAAAFWNMHDLIFENYATLKKPDFDAEEFKAFASEIGLDVAAFSQAYHSDKVKELVQQDIKQGRSIGVTGTPTMFLDGRRLVSYSIQANNIHFWSHLAKRYANPPSTAGQD